MNETPDPDERLDALVEEFTEALRTDAPPDIESYAAAHPDLADRIRSLFPVLQAMEAAEAQAPADPEQIGPYTITGKLGEGGMGVVYRAKDEAERPVAIKRIHQHLLGVQEYVRRFLREAQAGMRIEDPGVVRTVELGWEGVRDQPWPYVVLEYVDGEDLYALLSREGPLSERLVRHVGERMARALAAVHEAGLLHRDVKPENVVITPDETVKLMDMGVALDQVEMTRLSATGQFVGSRLYAAPEQVMGGALDARTDLYALGLVLFELLTGTHAWIDPRDADARLPMTPPPAPPVRDRLPGASPFIDAVIGTLLALDPEDRFTTAVELADVLAVAERSTWWHDTAARAPATGIVVTAPMPHVGREAEIAALDAAWARAASGQGGALLLTGEPGAGKTHLLRTWLAARADDERGPALLLAGGTADAEGNTLAAAIRAHFGVQRVRREVEALLDDLPQLASAFAAELAGVRGDGAGGLTEEGRSTAYVETLRRLAATAPVVLAYDDLAQTDDEERELFQRIVRGTRDTAVFTLGTVHDDLPPRLRTLTDEGGAETLAVPPLGAEAGHALLRALAPEVTERDLDIATERAEGNPLYLVELGRALGGRATETTLPDTLRGALEERVSRMDDTTREVLDAAACAGAVFDPLWIADALGRPRIGVLRAFAALEAEERLLESAGRSYRFRHRLMREAVLERMHPALRATLHEALASALLAATDDQYELEAPRAVAVAEHFVAGGDGKRASAYLEAALPYLQRRSPARALRLLDAVLAGDDLLSDGARLTVLCYRGRALLALTRREEAQAVHDDAAGLAEAAPPAGRLAHRELGAKIALADGTLDIAYERYMDAVEIAESIDDMAALARSLASAGLALTSLGRLDESRSLLARAQAAAEATDARALHAGTAVALARAAIRAGDLDEAEAQSRLALELCREIGDRHGEARATSVLAGTLSWRGRPAESLPLLERSLALSVQLGDLANEAATRGNLMVELYRLGRFDEATRQAEEAVRIADRIENRLAPINTRDRLAFMRAAAGRLEEARAIYAAALTMARDAQHFPMTVSISIFLADLLAVMGRAAEGRELLESAFADTPARDLTQYALNLEYVRGRLLETEGDYAGALAYYAAGLAGVEQGGFDSHRQMTQLALARSALRIDQGDMAAQNLAPILADDDAEPRLRVLALAHRARLPGADVADIAGEIERAGVRLDAALAVECAFALYEAGAGDAHLARAREVLGEMRESVVPEDRPGFDAVDLYRRVAEAGA